jgi:hypothetical protein
MCEEGQGKTIPDMTSGDCGLGCQRYYPAWISFWQPMLLRAEFLLHFVVLEDSFKEPSPDEISLKDLVFPYFLTVQMFRHGVHGVDRRWATYSRLDSRQ